MEVLLAGAFAALMVDTIVYPFDTLKTRIQSQDYASIYAKNRKVMFSGLYQGIGSVVVATVPASGTFFATYNGLKNVLIRLDAVPVALVYAAASGTGEVVSCAIIAPAEVIKQNAQMIRSSSVENIVPSRSSTLHIIAQFRNRPTALWTGYSALVARNLPFTMIQFPIFERLKLHLGGVDGSTIGSALAGGISGSLAAVVTTPIDLIKTRLMLSAGSSSSTQSAGLLNTARNVARMEGAKALWSGGALRSVWSFFGSGLYLGSYEWAKRRLESSPSRDNV